MRKIKVLVLSCLYPSVANPTAGIFIHQQVKQLQKEGYKIIVISPQPHSPRILWCNPRYQSYGLIPQSDLVDEVPVIYPRYFRLPGRWFHEIACHTLFHGIRDCVDSVMKDFQPHLLHAYEATPTGNAGLLLRNEYQLPLVCSCIGSDLNVYPYYNSLSMKLTQKIISEADCLTVVSQALKLKAESIGKPRHEIKVVHTGCNLNKFTYSEGSCDRIRASLGISLADQVLLFVGNIIISKGIFELIDAFAQLISKYPDIHLVFVGNGNKHLALMKRASHLKLNDKVHIVGRKPHSEIPHFLSAADILVLPSHREGLPNVVLEGMACQRPIVATLVGGIPEAVEDKVSGFLIPPKNVASLAKAISELLEDRNGREKMGKRGRQIIEQRFTWDKSTKRLRKVYDELVSKFD